MDLHKILVAVALGLLAHAFIGYTPFPFGDDFAYAPLADYRADPTLFARDDQLRMFDNHALVYDWVYALGTNTIGVDLVFRAAVWVLAAGVGVALWWALSSVGAPLFILPLVLAAGVLVRLDGMGRGDFGGLIPTFFHHHTVALVLLLGAVAAALGRRPWISGALLGLAVFAQPMTAFHGAIVVGLGALWRNPLDTAKIALSAVVFSLPAALPVLASILNAPDTAVTFDVINEAYRFRAPLHYDPSWMSVGLATLYLLAGFAGAVHLMRVDAPAARFTFGMMTGFAILHVVTLVVYKFGVLEWVGFFILDANRSTPALFVLGPAVALAGLWRAPHLPLLRATCILLIAILALNVTIAGGLFLILGLLIWRLAEVPRMKPILGIGLATALVVFFPAKPFRPVVPEPSRQVLEYIRDETPRDALFVIPVGLSEFRVIARRSAYVDFKLFSVAQPDQAALTRARIDEVARPAPENRDAVGWPAAVLWGEDQRRDATCARMVEILNETDADYYLRLVAPEETPPVCDALPNPVISETLALYGPSR